MLRNLGLMCCLCLLASPVMAQQALPDRIPLGAKFQQSEAVKARFPDVALPLTAPSLTKSPPQLTSHDEMTAFLTKIVEGKSNAAIVQIGQSQDGRSIPAVLFTREGVKSLDEARALGRPAIWFIGQQHGDEHAGGEAMLALAHRITHGPLAAVLDTMSVVIVPRANPDGAARDKRASTSGADLNRDHVLLTLAETRALHAAMARLPADVVFDHHEFSVANRWVEKFGGVQKADAMLLAATHPMIAPDIRAIGNELFLKRVEKDLAQHGLTSIVYMTTSYERKDPLVSTGGSAPGIARNAFGLNGAISYLVETRGVGIGMEGWQRRVATHVVIAEAVLGAVREGGKPLFDRLAAARRQVAGDTAPLPVNFALKRHPFQLPLVHPETGADLAAEVTLVDSREVTIRASRPRPAGYLVMAEADSAAERLRLNGIVSCRLQAAAEVDVESYAIPEPPKAGNREAINPDQTVKVTLAERRQTVPAGALYIPMKQAQAGMIAAAMEPDSPGSFVGVGILPVVDGFAPVARLKSEAAIAAAVPAACR